MRQARVTATYGLTATLAAGSAVDLYFKFLDRDGQYYVRKAWLIPDIDVATNATDYITVGLSIVGGSALVTSRSTAATGLTAGTLEEMTVATGAVIKYGDVVKFSVGNAASGKANRCRIALELEQAF